MLKTFKTSSVNRLPWIDYAKGLGILLVVYGHVLRGLNAAGGINQRFFYYSDNFIYSFHMPLFFILSGYFFYKSVTNNINGFIINKLKTLIYPFIIWSLLQTAIEVLLNKFTNSKTPPSELLTCLVIPRAQFWFLFALFFVNMINFVCYKINRTFWLLISFGLCLVFILLQPNLWSFTKPFEYLIFFNVGILCSRWNDKFLIFISKIKWLVVSLILFAAIEYLYFSFGISPNDYSLLFILTGITGSLLIIQIAERAISKHVFNFFSYLGKESLAIYLVHILAASGSRIVMKILGVQNPVLNVIAGTFLGMVVPLFVYHTCSKTVYLSWLFKYPDNRKTEEKLAPLP